MWFGDDGDDIFINIRRYTILKKEDEGNWRTASESDTVAR